MKKLVAWTLLVTMIVLAFAPLSAFADESDDLKKAIVVAKEKLEVPDSFSQFEYDVREIGGRKVWSMTWSSEDVNDGRVRASVDSDGMIVSYSVYRPGKHEGSKLPQFTKTEARDRAEVFMERMEPGLAGLLVEGAEEDVRIASGSYRFSYNRSVGEIPYYGNTVIIEIDKDTGKTISYWRDWDNEMSFPSADGIIGLEAAVEAYREKIGLELVYKYRLEGNEAEPYLAYVPKRGGGVWIDAFTGEVFEVEGRVYAGEAAKSVTEDSAMAMGLTPAEMNAIEGISELLDRKEAEDILRGKAETGIDRAFELESASLEKSWPEKDRFKWRLSFRKERDEGEETIMDYGYGTVDASTGEILSFGNYTSSYGDEPEIRFDREAAEAASIAFLEDFSPERFLEYVLEDADGPVLLERAGLEKEQRYYSFNFTRRVEGIPFRANRISIGFDAAEGKVRSYNLVHFQTDFPSKERAASINSAYDALNEKIGLELLYVLEEEGDALPRPIAVQDGKEVRLAYGLKHGAPSTIDAESLSILNPDGSVYEEPKTAAYDDLDGHYSREAVQTLAENGISLEGNLFRPGENITQKDFFLLFIHTTGYYMPNRIDEEFVENMYAYLVRQEIIGTEEVDYSASVTRGEAVKYLVRGLGYEEVAMLEDIFAEGFADVDNGYPELKGYVAIANGLGIVKGYGGLFGPENRLKRGDAAIMIFNRLSK